MTVTAQSFRASFPEFSDLASYPSATIDFWIDVAAQMLNASRWGTLLDTGIALFVAHNMVLERQNFRATINGGVPGIQSGVIASKGVDKVNISYDTASGVEEGAGHWNLTNYGSRFVRLTRMFGAGGIQIGVPCQ